MDPSSLYGVATDRNLSAVVIVPSGSTGCTGTAAYDARKMFIRNRKASGQRFLANVPLAAWCLDSDSIGAVEADISLIVVGASSLPVVVSSPSGHRTCKLQPNLAIAHRQVALHLQSGLWRIIIGLHPSVRHGCLPSSAIST